MLTRQRQQTPSDGSRTLTATIAPEQPAAGPSNINEQAEGEGEGGRLPGGVLKLRGGPRSRVQVAWTDDVVDNEGAGRKKSKICCIYRKPRAFDESSDESDSDGSDSDDPQHHDADCDNDHGHHHSHSRRNVPIERTGGGGDGVAAVAVVKSLGPGDKNAYEAAPQKGKGKGKQ